MSSEQGPGQGRVGVVTPGLDAAVALLQGMGGPIQPKGDQTPEMRTVDPKAVAAAAQVVEERVAAEAAAEKPPAKEAGPEARRFAVIARKERALLEREREAKAVAAAADRRVREMEAQLAALTKAEAERAERKAAYRRNPILALQDAGVSYEAITKAILADGEPGPEAIRGDVDALREELAAERQRIADELAARDKAAKETQRRAAERERTEAMAQVREEISETVSGDPDRYELLGLAGDEGQRLVLQALEAHFQSTGKAISYQEAADQVEAHLTEQAQRLLKTKRLGAAVPKPPSPGLGAVGAAPTPPARTMASEAERIRAAEEIVRGWVDGRRQ